MENKALFEAEIKSQYSKRFQRFGATPKGVFWVSTERQETRFDLILKEIQKISPKQTILDIADVGCGYGSFADYLFKKLNRSEFRYEGLDINEDFIEYCHRNFLDSSLRFAVGGKPSSNKDFIIMSGTYNLATTKNVLLWEQYLFDCLSECWAYAKSAMIFNLQTSETRRIGSQNIYYARTSDIIDFCVTKLGPTRITRDTSLENDVTFTIVR
jgi:2-polyprenyl-3-methyl-5-hydroxy-6-metoxy-1,4-benzoquinol methylase